MTRTISESMDQTNVLNEGLINFDMRELAAYVAKEDNRIKNICESLEFNMEPDFSNVSVDRVNKLYSIKEGNETLKIFLKKSLIENMDNYFRYRF